MATMDEVSNEFKEVDTQWRVKRDELDRLNQQRDGVERETRQAEEDVRAVDTRYRQEASIVQTRLSDKRTELQSITDSITRVFAEVQSLGEKRQQAVARVEAILQA